MITFVEQDVTLKVTKIKTAESQLKCEHKVIQNADASSLTPESNEPVPFFFPPGFKCNVGIIGAVENKAKEQTQCGIGARMLVICHQCGLMGKKKC